MIGSLVHATCHKCQYVSVNIVLQLLPFHFDAISKSPELKCETKFVHNMIHFKKLQAKQKVVMEYLLHVLAPIISQL